MRASRSTPCSGAPASATRSSGATGSAARAPANAFARKHDVLLFYARGPANTFHRLRGGVTPAMAAKYAHVDEHGRYQNAHGRRYYLKGGKPFDSVWDIPSIAPTARRARRAIPTQKPLALLERVIARDHGPRRARRRSLRRQRHDGRGGAAPRAAASRAETARRRRSR